MKPGLQTSTAAASGGAAVRLAISPTGKRSAAYGTTATVESIAATSDSTSARATAQVSRETLRLRVRQCTPHQRSLEPPGAAPDKVRRETFDQLRSALANRSPPPRLPASDDAGACEIPGRRPPPPRRSNSFVPRGTATGAAQRRRAGAERDGISPS